jgi:hypothetical protein
MTAPSTFAPAPADLDCGAFTPKGLAAYWNKIARDAGAEEEWTEEMVRDRCRSGAIPAKKIGVKNWIIPRATLAAWFADPSRPEPSRPKAPTQPYKIVVRKP